MAFQKTIFHFIENFNLLNYTLYILITILIIATYLGVSLYSNIYTKPKYYFIFILICVVIGRYPNYTRLELNTDESLVIAGVDKLKESPIFWEKFDGITQGPTVFYLILPWTFMGIKPDYGLLKLEVSLFYAVYIMTLFLVLRIYTNKRGFLAFSIMPIFIYSIYSSLYDLAAYNATHVSLFFSCCIICLASNKKSISLPKIILASILFYLMVLSKMQVILWALTLFAFLFLTLNRKQKFQFLLSLALIGIAFLVYLYKTNTIEEFYNHYIITNINYKIYIKGITSSLSISQIHARFIFKMLKFKELTGILATFISLMVVTIILFLIRGKNNYQLSLNNKAMSVPHKFKIIILFVILLITSIYCVIIASTYYINHYLYFIISSLFFIGLFIVYIFQALRLNDNFSLTIIGLTLTIVFKYLIYQSNDAFTSQDYNKLLLNNKYPIEKYIFENTDKEDKIVFYGYMDRLFVYSERISGARMINITEFLKSTNPYKDEILSNFLKDIKESKPQLFIAHKNEITNLKKDKKFKFIFEKYKKDTIINEIMVFRNKHSL